MSLARLMQQAAGAANTVYYELPAISDLEIWLDASDDATLFQDSAKTSLVTADGQSVQCWADKSGNGYDHLLQSDIAVPTYDTSTMHRGSLSFNNSESLYDPTSKETITAFFVTAPSTANSNVLFGFDSSTNKYIHFDTGGTVYFSLPNGNYTPISGYSGPDVGQQSVITADLRNFINFNFTRYDAVSPSSYTGGTPTGTYIGRRHNSGTNARPYYGNIAEVITYSRRLSSTEIESVEDYLNGKWKLGLLRQ